jgi:hypothetical protein
LEEEKIMRIIDPDSIAWREAHQKTLVEPDKTKLLKHVYATEEALFLRWQELYLRDGSADELHEMDSACKDLLRIKIDELGWPPIRVPKYEALCAAINEGGVKVALKADGTETSSHAS